VPKAASAAGGAGAASGDAGALIVHPGGGDAGDAASGGAGSALALKGVAGASSVALALGGRAPEKVSQSSPKHEAPYR
jgi:hypothetical protein